MMHLALSIQRRIQELTMTTARKYVLETLFQGNPKKSDFKIVEETLPAIQDGGKLGCKLCKLVWAQVFNIAIYCLNNATLCLHTWVQL